MTGNDRGHGRENEEHCPSWCVAEHEHQGDDHQRWHFSTCHELQLSELAGPVESEGPRVEVSLPFDVCLERPWGAKTTYVLIGVGAEQARTFCLTLESADRLAAAMSEVASDARRRG
ncbi:DUF6907 domain-containing protein [Microbacterium sp. HMH0099]|uniref:DUF6907 domain-containing protein n=1 Tax=Microbacterium sp. HMH0099 TaxID=3414026 RepID=UPI003BF67405